MKNFVGEIDTPGGHITICVLLLLLAAAFHKFQVPKADDLIVFALATMGRSMLGKNGKGAGGDPAAQ